MGNARKFRIKGLLGKGGFGLVYRATLVAEGGFQTEVAVKLLKSEVLSRPMLARFKDEARVLGLIRDRAVVRVFPPALLDGTPALIMEYVDGLATSSILKKNQGPLPPRVVTEIVSEIARSLHDVFNQLGPQGKPLRLVHRDIKPANIQVTPNGTVKLLDFGIAKAAFEGREAETTVHLFGTPQYMAPERLAGETGPESDIFSLGCTWRRLMTGDRPIGGGQFKKSQKPPTPTRLLEEALGFIDKMIAIEEAERPTAAEVHDYCDDLARRMGGESLRRWAGGNIISAPAEPDDLSGTVMMESIALDSSFDLALPTVGETGVTVLVAGASSTGTMATDSVSTFDRQETYRRLMLYFGAIAMLLGFLAMIPGCYGVYLLEWFGPVGAVEVKPVPLAVPAPSPLSEPNAVPEPVVDPVPVEPPPAVVEEPEPVAPSNPRPSQPSPTPVQPAPIEPQPADPLPTIVPKPAMVPEPKAPSTGTLRIDDGGAIVIIRDGAGKRVSPGALAPGRYEISANFDKRDPSALEVVATINLSAGTTVTVRCVAQVHRCIVK